MKKEKRFTRREFIEGVTATAATISIIKPELVRGSAANSKIKLGLIGCGGRGKWIMDLFKKHGGYELYAGHDYFQDRVDDFANKFDVAKERCFTGLDGYKKLLGSGVDAVAIESPPYFHPQQAADAVKAGVHVYLAKPIAVDVPGCQSIEASGKQARTQKLCYLIDICPVHSFAGPGFLPVTHPFKLAVTVA